MTVLEQAADYIVSKQFSYGEREMAASHIIDTITALICGSFSPEGKKLLSTFYMTDHEKLFGTSNGKNGALDDVMIYSSLTRLTEVDDIHLSSCTTPGSVIVPTVLALTPIKKDLSYEAMIDATIVGYDMVTRLGEMIDGAHILGRGIWPTFFCAAFGTAATASRMLGSSVEETVHALAFSLTMSTGGVSRSSDLTFRWLTLGNAARSGVFAAIMASKGFKGDPQMLENNWLEKTYGIKADPSLFIQNLGKDQVMNKISMKPFCAAKQVIPSLQGLNTILDKDISPDEINEIIIKIPNEFVNMVDHGAHDRISSLTSIPYQLALLVYQPEHLYDINRTQLVQTIEMQSFMEKVKIFGNRSLSECYPKKWKTIIEVTTNKDKFTEIVEHTHGDPEQRLTMDEIQDKHLRILQQASGLDEAENIVQKEFRGILLSKDLDVKTIQQLKKMVDEIITLNKA